MRYPLLLSSLQRYRLSQSLSVSYSCLDSDGGNCGVLRSALGVTCRLYEANTILPKINLPNPTDQDVLQIMSEKSLADSCTWVNETLTNIAGSSGLPSGVQCSNVSSLAGVCSQWSDSVAIMRIESKVDRLNPMILNETTWLNDKKINATALFLDCPGPSCILD